MAVISIPQSRLAADKLAGTTTLLKNRISVSAERRRYVFLNNFTRFPRNLY
jgi:hypothetical protein